MAVARERAPRKDVARNRKRLLEAGREVFATQGLEATLDDIARWAGVGAGTAYRHFGSRQEIITAIFSDVAHDFIQDAEQALAAADPWHGFVALLETVAGRQAADRGLHQVFMGGYDECVSDDDWKVLAGIITAVLDRAKAAGALRTDIELSDVVGLFAMMGPMFDLSSGASSPIWRRQIDIFLRGMHADAAPAALDVPPAVSAESISAAMGISR